MNTFLDQHATGATWQGHGGGGAPGPEAGGATAAQRTGPGRPSGCTQAAVGMLRGIIRETGVSDSAAAVRLGMGASTVSRWKREDPEVRVYLQQAREECRALQLQKIAEAAAAEKGRGWRAAAWMLERLFPQDYAMNAGVREGHRQVAELRAEREERAHEEAERQERQRWRAGEVSEVVMAEGEEFTRGEARRGVATRSKSPDGETRFEEVMHGATTHGETTREETARGESTREEARREGSGSGAVVQQPSGGATVDESPEEASTSAVQGRTVIPMPAQAVRGGAPVSGAGLGVSPSPRAYEQPASEVNPRACAQVPGETPATALGTSAPPSIARRAQRSPFGS